MSVFYPRGILFWKKDMETPKSERWLKSQCIAIIALVLSIVGLCYTERQTTVIEKDLKIAEKTYAIASKNHENELENHRILLDEHSEKTSQFHPDLTIELLYWDTEIKLAKSDSWAPDKTNTKYSRLFAEFPMRFNFSASYDVHEKDYEPREDLSSYYDPEDFPYIFGLP